MTETTHRSPNEGQATEKPERLRALGRRLLTVPGMIVAAVISTVVAWGVAKGLHVLFEGSAAPRGAVAMVVEANPGVVSGLEHDLMFGVLPERAHPAGSAGPGCSGFVPWVRRHSGIDGRRTLVRVIVQGVAPTPVLISGLAVRKQLVGPPLRGTPVFCAGAQGEVQIRTISVDLDKTPATVLYDFGRRTFGFTLGQGQTEVLDIDAATDRSRIRWTMALQLVVAGRHEEVPVSDDGRPFETTALSAGAATWTWESPQWLPPTQPGPQ